MQETQTNLETVPTVLLAENTESPVGFAVLAQNALSIVIVSVGGAIILLGKLFWLKG